MGLKDALDAYISRDFHSLIQPIKAVKNRGLGLDFTKHAVQIKQNSACLQVPARSSAGQHFCNISKDKAQIILVTSRLTVFPEI